MSLLAQLPKITTRSKKRLGRGIASGKGVKSTRGTTRHQKARGKIPLAFEGGQGKLVKRFPLLRGKSKNKAIFKKPYLVSVHKLNLLQDGDEVTIEFLKKQGIVGNDAAERGVKIVGSGNLEKKLTIHVLMSEGVKNKLGS